MTEGRASGTKEWRDELKSKVSLQSIVSTKIHTEKRGGVLWACCPFHHEKTPSFAVYDDHYHCYGCGESGDVYKFVMKYENLEFWEAAAVLAESAGMEMPKRFDNAEAQEYKKKKDRLLALTRDAANFYYRCLKSDAGEIARAYLMRRGIDEDIQKLFGLGYSPGWTDAIEYLQKKGYSAGEMKEACVAEITEEGRVYDVFSGRLIIPIVNALGDVIAFGGRILEKDAKAAKYRNSANGLLFDKRKVLFGLNIVKRKKQREPLKHIIVVEGYMDVISLTAAGLDCAVASMGTAFGPDQCRLLRPYKETLDCIYFCYDGDAAGQTKTLERLDVLDEREYNFKIVCLPEGQDPDDFIKAEGKEAFERLLENALTPTQFRMRAYRAALNTETQDGRAKYAAAAAKAVARLENPVEQEEYLKTLARETNYTLDSLKKQVAVSVNEPEPEYSYSAAPPETLTPTETPLQKAALFMLNAMFHKKPYADKVPDLAPYLPEGIAQVIYGYACECIALNKEPRAGEIMEGLTDEEANAAGAIIDMLYKGDAEQHYAACRIRIEDSMLESEVETLQKQYDQETDKILKREIAMQIAKLQGKRRLKK